MASFALGKGRLAAMALRPNLSFNKKCRRRPSFAGGGELTSAWYTLVILRSANNSLRATSVDLFWASNSTPLTGRSSRWTIPTKGSLVAPGRLNCSRARFSTVSCSKCFSTPIPPGLLMATHRSPSAIMSRPCLVIKARGPKCYGKRCSCRGLATRWGRHRGRCFWASRCIRWYPKFRYCSG